MSLGSLPNMGFQKDWNAALQPQQLSLLAPGGVFPGKTH